LHIKYITDLRKYQRAIAILHTWQKKLLAGGRGDKMASSYLPGSQ